MNGKRPTSVCAFWRVASFYKVQYEHIKRDMNWACTCVCFKFAGACFCQKLAKLDEIWQRYHKNKKGDVFLRHSVDIINLSITFTHQSFITQYSYIQWCGSSQKVRQWTCTERVGYKERAGLLPSYGGNQKVQVTQENLFETIDTNLCHLVHFGSEVRKLSNLKSNLDSERSIWRHKSSIMARKIDTFPCHF